MGADSTPKIGRTTFAGPKRIALICPTMWDEAELPHIVSRGDYQILPYGADVSEHPEDFDALGFIEQAVAEFREAEIDGVMASDDYPGSIVAAAIADRLNLPGPSPEKILLCQHKYYSRIAQREAMPEAVPSFALLQTDGSVAAGEVTFPTFVKPVKSFFSVLAERVENAEELERIVARAQPHLYGFVRPFNALLGRFTDYPVNGSHLLAETPLRGSQVTVEGCVFQGEVMIIGVTDSIMHPGTTSFARFEYPSVLDLGVQERMSGIAARFISSIGFDNGLFNIEMFYDPSSNSIHIIEVNPRMCPQFADLMEKVNGVNTYEIALATAAGVRPVVCRPGAAYPAAVSYVLRLFEDKIVRGVPNTSELRDLGMRFPDARLKILCEPGRQLSQELQDGQSYRYAILNMGGRSREDAIDRSIEALRGLTFVFGDIRDREVMPEQSAADGAVEHSVVQPHDAMRASC
jgi:biotin carboxylase